MNSTNPVKPSSRLRLIWACAKAQETGTLSRADIMGAWGISAAQASADISAIHEAAPNALHYDLQGKVYLWKGGSGEVFPATGQIKEIVRLLNKSAHH